VLGIVGLAVAMFGGFYAWLKPRLQLRLMLGISGALLTAGR
jgi:hypothetical protein